MQKLFDDRLASRMKLVFDSHQEEYNPGDWENMREKSGKKSRKKLFFVLPFIAKAASVILIIGLSVFYVNQNQSNKNTIRLTNTNNENKIDSIIVNKNQEKKQNNSGNKSLISDDYKENNAFQKHNPENNEMVDINNQNTQLTILPVDSSKLILADIKNVLENHRNNIQKLTNKERIDSNESKKPMLTNEDDFEIIPEKKKQFEFGVELASVSNYSPDATGSNLNVGGGFSAGYKISKNLTIASGLNISKQSLEYKGNDNLYSSPSNLYYADNNSINIIDANSVDSEMDFVTIDIPLKLRYRINKIILSVGISSLLFLNETYSSSYDVTTNNISYNSSTLNYETVSTTQNIRSDIPSESFIHFDLASLLNFSVAYDMPMQKGSIAFEPYVKLPLAGLSSYNINMGSGGLTFRYNF